MQTRFLAILSLASALLGCAQGQTASSSGAPIDPESSIACGDGVVQHDEETCDTAIAAGSPGACPSSCEDNLGCTEDLVMHEGTCNAVCANTPITVCRSGDGCCPAGCETKQDSDCSMTCGNQVVEKPEETCDTGIAQGAGVCPTQCDDGVSCTRDHLLNGGTCSATCFAEPIVACNSGDGCCPAGCGPQTDEDCSTDCGNGTVEVPKESCDIGIADGLAGACPTSCDNSRDSCMSGTLLNAGTCAAVCSYSPITQCRANDACCPVGCSSDTDSDCASECGNGTVEGPQETCDIGISQGAPGACPSSCEDNLACTKDTLLNPGTCTASCSTTQITQCVSGDNCCPTGCKATADNDCSPMIPITDGLFGGSVSSIATNPQNPAHMIAGTMGGGLYDTHDGGLNWTRIGTSIEDTAVISVTMSPSQPSTVYAIVTPRVTDYTTSGASAYRSNDSGVTWSKLSIPAVDDPREVVVDAKNPNVLLIAYSKHLYKSSDGGTTWTPIQGKRGQESQLHTLDYGRPRSPSSMPRLVSRSCPRSHLLGSRDSCKEVGSELPLGATSYCSLEARCGDDFPRGVWGVCCVLPGLSNVHLLDCEEA